MKLWCILFIVVSFNSSFAKSNKFKKLEFSSGIGTDIVESEVVKARILGFHFGLDVEYKISQKIKYYLTAAAILETGSNEVIGTFAEFEPTESVHLNAGGLIYRPWKYFKSEIGAINQETYNSPLLVGSIPFAATSIELGTKSIYGKAEIAIPSNNVLSKRIGAIETGTPTFQMSTLGLDLGRKHKFKFEASYFKFNDISFNVAEKSQAFGNSTEEIGQATSFLYGHEGINIFSEVSLVIGGMRIEVGGQYLFNDKAPEGRNKGALGFLTFKDDSFDLKIEGFRNESDSSIGFYNSRNYGHNNVFGQAVSLNSNSNSISKSIRFSRFEPIVENGIQDETFILSGKITKVFDL